MERELIEDYGIIGDLHTVALISKRGSIDWLCLPRFDSNACLARLIGSDENGFWRITPKEPVIKYERRYLPRTLILETTFTTASGKAKIIDFMPPRNSHPSIYRLVEGIDGVVDMTMELIVRFDYGTTVPWVRHIEGGLSMVSGSGGLAISSNVALESEDFKTIANFQATPGETQTFSAIYHDSITKPPAPHEARESFEHAFSFWQTYMNGCKPIFGEYQEVVERSIITLKALTYQPTGAIVASPTTSLPEQIGGIRNWDYRYCWLRDATFTLYALMIDGFEREALKWREWLLRAAAGDPTQLQIMYGIGGERLIPEFTIPWLSGYRDSAPVRIGNAASNQFQLDVYGELMDAFYQFRRSGIKYSEESWHLQLVIVDFVAKNWDKPDEGIWEIRGPRRHFTYSKVMAWVVFDRAIKLVERYGMAGNDQEWRTIRDDIHKSIMANGYNEKLGYFVQDYESTNLDASLLLLPLVGFIDAADPKMVRTAQAIDERLSINNVVKRYETGESGEDGLPGDEGVFLACSFWLVDNMVLAGKTKEAKIRFDKLLQLGNELGLFSEEYDPNNLSMLGNFPQALTHVALINTARNVTQELSPAKHRTSS